MSDMPPGLRGPAFTATPGQAGTLWARFGWRDASGFEGGPWPQDVLEAADGADSGHGGEGARELVPAAGRGNLCGGAGEREAEGGRLVIPAVAAGAAGFNGGFAPLWSLEIPGLPAWVEPPGDWMAQAVAELGRFASLQDGSVRTAVAAMLLLGVGCGLLGCFLVLRRLSLLGDSLGHAVLPGIAVGFLVTGTKHPGWLFAGAMSAALLAGAAVVMVQRQTRLKPDVAMGLVLSAFFGFGLMLLSRIQSDPRGGQGGLSQFFYGQAAAISATDLGLIVIVTAVIVGCVLAGYRLLLVSSFDEGFATTLGLPTRRIHVCLLVLTALAIVISIQAVGVVLLSALLITPAATALLLTDRLPRALLISTICATVGGVGGLALSSLSAPVWTGALRAMLGWVPGLSGWVPGWGLRTSPPTGPVVVLVLSGLFGLAFFLAPRHGLIPGWGRRMWRRLRPTPSERGDRPGREAAEGDESGSGHTPGRDSTPAGFSGPHAGGLGSGEPTRGEET